MDKKQEENRGKGQARIMSSEISHTGWTLLPVWLHLQHFLLSNWKGCGQALTGSSGAKLNYVHIPLYSLHSLGKDDGGIKYEYLNIV